MVAALDQPGICTLLALGYRGSSAKVGYNVPNMGPRLIARRKKRSLRIIMATST